MDLKELESFLAVARLRSFVKASDALGTGQSTVTKHIRKLEAELGRPLFERATRPIELTVAGTDLLQMAGPLVKGIRAMTAADLAVRDRAPVVIACAHGFLNELMLAAVRAFRDRFAHDRVRLRLGTKEEVTEMVLTSQVDLAITPTPGRLAGIAFHPLAVSERVLITPPDHALLRQELTALADIATYPLILLGHRTATRTLLEDAFRRSGTAYEVAVEIDSMDMVKRYVELGLGVAVGHSIALDPGDSLTLGIVPLGRFLPSELVGIVTSRQHALSDAARAFIKVVHGLIHTTADKPKRSRPPPISARS